MRSVRPAAVVLLVVVAGCSGVAGDPPRRFTVTPAPVPTVTPEPDDGGLAPGLEPGGVVDPEALVEAHARALEGRSYTVDYAETRRRNGTTVLRYTRHIQLEVDRNRYCYRTGMVVDRGPDPWRRYVERWTDGRQVLEAVEEDNATAYGVARNRQDVPARPAELLPFDPTYKRGLFTLFLRLNTTVAGREERNGTTVYRVEAAGPGTLSVPSLDDLSLTAYVEGTGMVRGYRLSYTVTLDEGPMTITGRLRFTGVGTTTVERPPWYGRALANTTVDRSVLAGQADAARC